jgi:pentatricopeptide repeat protein
MRTDGLEASTVVLNSLINAFGEDRRLVEAFSVLQFMKENVSNDFALVLLS